LLFVVRRGAVDRFRQLETSFAPEGVGVIWDRRLGERRLQHASTAPDRRRRDRRGLPPPTWGTLDFVTVAPGRPPTTA
jgi:hypothetical protein